MEEHEEKHMRVKSPTYRGLQNHQDDSQRGDAGAVRLVAALLDGLVIQLRGLAHELIQRNRVWVHREERAQVLLAELHRRKITPKMRESVDARQNRQYLFARFVPELEHVLHLGGSLLQKRQTKKMVNTKPD